MFPGRRLLQFPSVRVGGIDDLDTLLSEWVSDTGGFGVLRLETEVLEGLEMAVGPGWSYVVHDRYDLVEEGEVPVHGTREVVGPF